MLYKVFHGMSTDYLHECYQKRSGVNIYNLPNSDFLIPKPLTNYLKKSIL